MAAMHAFELMTGMNYWFDKCEPKDTPNSHKIIQGQQRNAAGHRDRYAKWLRSGDK